MIVLLYLEAMEVNIVRLPRVAADPASALPDVHAYLSAVRKMDEADNRCDEMHFSSRVPM